MFSIPILIALGAGVAMIIIGVIMIREIIDFGKLILIVGIFTVLIPTGLIIYNNLDTPSVDDFVEAVEAQTIPDEIVSVEINGVRLTFNGQQPIKEDDRVFVPVREIFEPLGYTVVMDENTNEIMATNGKNTVHITIGESAYTANGNTHSLEVSTHVHNDTIMMPVKIFENIGYEIEWDSAEKKAAISVIPDTPAPTPQPTTTPKQTATATKESSSNNRSTSSSRVYETKIGSDGTVAIGLFNSEGYMTEGKVTLPSGQIQEGTFNNNVLVKGKVTWEDGTVTNWPQTTQKTTQQTTQQSKPEKVQCMPCNGTGKIRCSDCNGTGSYEKYIWMPNNKSYYDTVSCIYCSMRGTKTCTHCDGTGWRTY